MPKDLLYLPGYPGHDEAQAFIEDCVRGIPGEALAGGEAPRAELSWRVSAVSGIPYERIAELTAP